MIDPEFPRARASLTAAVLALLASCQRSSSTASAAQPLVTNLGLAGVALLGEGELWLVLVREADQDGRDLNGDGDALDDVVHVLDLASGTVTNTRLALRPLASARGDAAAPILAVGGSAAAFAVSEFDQGALDLNQDGDTDDLVLHVFERSTGSTTNLGFAVHSAQAGGELVAFAVNESAQGGLDLDGDGSADAAVLHVHDLSTGVTVNLQLHDSVPLAIQDEFVALRLSETPGLDLNWDGDDLDPEVLELYDARRQQIHAPGLALAAGSAIFAGGVCGVLVSERDQGQSDLNGDGLADDAVFHTYDPRTGLVRNLGLSSLVPAPAADRQRFLLSVPEPFMARDLNGDGDALDQVVEVYEPALDRLQNSRSPSRVSPVLAGDWLALLVAEDMQGMDLDRDGALDGNVAQVLELASGATRNLGLDATQLAATDTHVLLLARESSAGRDWNGDGDEEDSILFSWDPAQLGPRNTRLALLALLGTAGELALVAEESHGGGVGAADDPRLALFDARSGRLVRLGLAWSAANAHLTSQGVVVGLVSELAQGADLDGDGDQLDSVLHIVER